MGLKEAVKGLLDDMQEAHKKGDFEKVQSIAESVVMVETYKELFDSIMKRIEVYGKELVLGELETHLRLTQSFNSYYGFSNVDSSITDIEDVIEFVTDSL